MDEYSPMAIALMVMVAFSIVGGVSNFVEKRGFPLHPLVAGIACGFAFLVFIFGIIDLIRIFIVLLGLGFVWWIIFAFIIDEDS